MCSATLGAGALSLPYAVEQVGAAGGVLMLLLTSAASHYSTVLLVSAIVQTGTRSYEELTVRLFGRTMGAITEVAIVLFCYGSAIAYTMALGDLVHPFASPLGLDQRTTICLIWLFLMLPLSLVEKISQLHWPSLFGVLSVIYLVLSVVAHACLCAVQEFTIASAAAPTASAESAGLERIVGGEDGRMYLFAWGPSSMEAVAIALFAFTCRVNVPALRGARGGGRSIWCPAPPPSQLLFPAAAEGPYSTPPQPHMEQRTQRQTPQHQQQPNPQQKQQQELLPVTKRSEPMKKVSFRAMCICLTCYLLVGLAGYRDAPSSPNGNLLKNYCVVASTHSLVPTHSSSPPHGSSLARHGRVCTHGLPFQYTPLPLHARRDALSTFRRGAQCGTTHYLDVSDRRLRVACEPLCSWHQRRLSAHGLHLLCLRLLHLARLIWADAPAA